MPSLRLAKPSSAIARLGISILLAAALVPAAPFGPAPSALAASLLVNSSADPGDGTCDGSCTLRDAILGAALSAGPDTITFSAGVTSTIVLGSALPTIAEALTIDGSGQSIKVDGNNAFRVFRSSAPLTLTALTIQNGRAPSDAFGGGGAYFGSAGTILSSSFISNSTPFHSGGGAWIEGAAFVSGTAFLTNTAFIVGGGLYVNTGLITGSTFISNSAGLEGGGAYIFVSGAITGSTFTRNTAVGTFNSDGGGATIIGPATLVNTQFISNTAIRNGGGVRFYDTAAISDGTFRGTAAGSGGGAYLPAGGGVTTTTFLSNTAFADGGGLYMGSNVVSLSGPGGDDVAPITDATFTGNRAESGGGGGAYIARTSAIKGSSFTRNSAGAAGGGAFSIGGVVISVTLSDYFTNTAVSGGGGSFGTATVTGGRFFGNSATSSGGGASFSGPAVVSGTTFSDNTASGDGGGAQFGDSAMVTRAAFFRNTTTGQGGDGGGAAFGGLSVITGTSFVSNTAGNGNGGGLIAGGTVMTNTTLSGNKALCEDERSGRVRVHAPAGPQCGDGGGGYFSGAIDWVVSLFTSNHADRDGGGAHVSPGIACEIRVINFNSNSAGSRGGGLYQASGQSDIGDLSFTSNEAGDDGGGAYLDFAFAQIDNTYFARNNTINGAGADEIGLSISGSTLNLRHVTLASATTGSGLAVSVGTVNEGHAATIINTIFDGYALGVHGKAPTSTVSMTGVLWSNVTLPFSGGDVDVNQEHFGSAAFVNAAGGDYHLTSASAAINIGVPTNLTVDFDGDPRNVGGAPDAGADESSGMQPPAKKLYFPLLTWILSNSPP
jgi:predicted outer membrane repeat protein